MLGGPHQLLQKRIGQEPKRKSNRGERIERRHEQIIQ